MTDPTGEDRDSYPEATQQEGSAVPAGPADQLDADVERLLRAALTARSLQIDERHLRQARPPIAPTGDRPRTGSRPAQARARRRWGTRRATDLFAAAAAAGVLVTAGVVGTAFLDRPPDPPPVASGPTTTGPTPSEPVDPRPPLVVAPPPSGPVAPAPTVHVVQVTPDAAPAAPAAPAAGATLTLTPTSEPVPDTAATVTYPLATVPPGAGPAQGWAKTINARVAALRAAFRARVLAGPDQEVASVQTIDVRTDAQWGHTLSVVLDVLEDRPGQGPVSTTLALVLDKRTGRELTAADLFTDVPAADARLRAALQASLPAGTPATATLRNLSMRPGPTGTTRPLAWYPTAQGLHWTVDPGAVPTTTRPATTAPWNTLADLLLDRTQLETRP